MSTDDALVERMAVAMHTDDIRRGRAFLPLDEMDPLARESYYDNARALLPEVRKAQAEAWDEGWGFGYTDRHLGRNVDGYIEIDPTPNPYRAEQEDER